MLDAEGLLERYDIDESTAADAAAHPGSYRHYTMEITVEKDGILPVWLSGYEYQGMISRMATA